MTTALQKLLQYPHRAVFDKRPWDARALVLDVPWSVADGVMTVGAPPSRRLALAGSQVALNGSVLGLHEGGAIPAYDLSQWTIATLAQDLTDRGVWVSFVSPDVAHLSALVLVEGSGSASVPLTAFTSMLWVLMSAYAAEVRDLRVAVVEALAQLDLNTATLEWVDLYGALFGGVTRHPGELDRAYATRIKAEALRLRVNRYGIEQAIYDETGYTVAIEEPWESLFMLDQSVLSGPDRMFDGVTVGQFLIQPVGLVPGVAWDKVLPVIARNKAAGVIVLEPQTNAGFFVDSADASGQGVSVAAYSTMVGRSRCDDRALLDYMDLDADAHTPVHDALVLTRNLLSGHSTVPAMAWGEFPGWSGSTSWEGATYYAWDAASSEGFPVIGVHAVYDGALWNPDTTWETGGTWGDAPPTVTVLTSHLTIALGTIALDNNPVGLDGQILVLTS